MIDSEQVGRNLTLLRRQKDLSQQELADLCSVTHQAVSKWENGAALPDMQTMLFLSRYFGVPMETILSGDIQPVREEAAPAPLETEATPPAETPSAPGWDQIIGLAPFASREVIDSLVMQAMETRGSDGLDWDMVSGLFPFASQATLETLFSRYAGEVNAEALVALAPFVSRDFLARIAEQMRSCPDPDALMALAPFLPRKTVDELILGRTKKTPSAKAED